MNISNKSNREELALDALVAATVIYPDCDNVHFTDLQKLQSTLTPEDIAALKTVPSDLVDQILEGSLNSTNGTHTPTTSESRRNRTMETSMNRGDETGDLSEAARLEMERKRREAEDKNDNHAEGSSA